MCAATPLCARRGEKECSGKAHVLAIAHREQSLRGGLKAYAHEKCHRHDNNNIVMYAEKHKRNGGASEMIIARIICLIKQMLETDWEHTCVILLTAHFYK